MIDRLNFFDVYGYLIPGLVFVLVVTFPHALQNPTWFSIELGSGLLAILVAYIVGHQLHGLADLTFVSKLQVKGELRHYSDFILYDHDPIGVFGDKKLRTEIRQAVAAYFDTQEDTGHRHFRDCRSILLHKKRAGYAEQFEGMYVLSRGVSLACFLGATHLLGWAVGFMFLWRIGASRAAAVGAATAALGALAGATVLFWMKLRQASPVPKGLVFLFRLRRVKEDEDLEEKANLANRKDALDRRAAWCVVGSLSLFLLAAGIASAGSTSQAGMTASLWTGAFTCALIGLRSYSAFRHFALLFAQTVYRDFYVMFRDEERQRRRDREPAGDR